MLNSLMKTLYKKKVSCTTIYDYLYLLKKIFCKNYIVQFIKGFLGSPCAIYPLTGPKGGVLKVSRKLYTVTQTPHGRRRLRQCFNHSLYIAQKISTAVASGRANKRRIRLCSFKVIKNTVGGTFFSYKNKLQYTVLLTDRLDL